MEKKKKGFDKTLTMRVLANNNKSLKLSAEDVLLRRKIQVLIHETTECIRHKRFDLAYEAATLAVAFKPTSYKLLRIRCFACVLREDWAGALRDAQGMIYKDGATADGYYFRGLALYGMKKYVESSKDFLKALRLNPGDKFMDHRFWETLTFIKQKKLVEMMKANTVFTVKSKSVREAEATKWMDNRFRPPPPLQRRRKVDPIMEEAMQVVDEVENILVEEDSADMFTEEELAKFRRAVDDMMMRMLGMSSQMAALDDDADLSLLGY